MTSAIPILIVGYTVMAMMVSVTIESTKAPKRMKIMFSLLWPISLISALIYGVYEGIKTLCRSDH